MTTARSEQIDLSSTNYYHCMTRCVRRSFLCGIDFQTGRDYSHRKQWLVDRIEFLASIFAIRICAYAVMSNHYHLVLFVDESEAKSWTDEDIRYRWEKIFSQDAKNFDALVQSGVPKKIIEQKLELWRERLTSISWFMRCLNEKIAKQSNKEDEMTGRFWEGRFKSQALLDEGAVLSAMAYVDLNPIRAGIAKTPEQSEFTSIYDRIMLVSKELKKAKISFKLSREKIIQDQQIAKICDQSKQPTELMPFFTSIHHPNPAYIDFKLSDYLRLIDETGKALRDDKRGAISEDLAPILSRINLSTNGWLSMVKGLERNFSYMIGNVSRMADFIKQEYSRSPKGSTAAKQSYLDVVA